MKKIAIASLGGGLFVIAFLFLIIAGMGGAGGSAGVLVPIPAFATEEEAYKYQYVGTELGAPWDIVLLADVIDAQENGKNSLAEYNPIYTALEFCVIVEEKWVAIKEAIEPEESETEVEEEAEEEVEEEAAEAEEGTESTETEETETEEEAESEEPEYTITWVVNATNSYVGTEEILAYLKMENETLTYEDAANIVVNMKKRAEEKYIEEETQYIPSLIPNPDYESVMRERLQISDGNIESILTYYDAGYMAYLYGYTNEYDVTLPNVVVGNVSRMDLARVAVSLLNHPYMLGGKSLELGAPKGPLDGSGYIDWVYLQCFGVTVSSGSVPEGIVVSGATQQWFATEEISEKKLKIGDLGFTMDPTTMKDGQVNQVGIYLGEYNGKKLWIHCSGAYFGTTENPRGRVGISKSSGKNDYNPVTGTTFSPSMNGCKFKYYRRPRFSFTDD